MIEDLRQKILQSRLKMHVNDETHQCLNTLWFILLVQKDESDSWKQHLSPYCLEKVERYFNSS
tara:strand:- start:239 stop:427 length:189 start_codon:yes stop_codon:yes gene_type:complete